MTNVTSVLITGANAGLGKECARQLGLREEVKKIYLGCRSKEKAEAAKTNLEASTGRKDLYEILIIDVSKPSSVKQAVENLNGNVDGVVLNAGGKGGKDHMTKTEFGAPAVVAVNVLGHALLVDELLKSKKIVSGASVVFSGSETARGVPTYQLPRPSLENGSVEEICKYVDGSIYEGKKQSFEETYGRTKYVGTLYISSMARKEPSIRFVTMSPGATTGTNVTNDLPMFWTVMSKIAMPVMAVLGTANSLKTGAKRYVDALEDEETYKTGHFYASKKGVSGPVADQISFNQDFANETYQDNAYIAIHKFLD